MTKKCDYSTSIAEVIRMFDIRRMVSDAEVSGSKPSARDYVRGSLTATAEITRHMNRDGLVKGFSKALYRELYVRCLSYSGGEEKLSGFVAGLLYDYITWHFDYIAYLGKEPNTGEKAVDDGLWRRWAQERHDEFLRAQEDILYDIL